MFKKARPLKDPSDAEHAYNYALFVLNISMRTEGEMKEKMIKRGYDSSVVEEVIKRLITDKYLGDARYAEVYINSMKNFKSWGRYMMKKKMLLKKLPMDLIESSLQELLSKEEEQEIAERYVKKMLKQMSFPRVSQSETSRESRSGSPDLSASGGSSEDDMAEQLAKLSYQEKQKIKARLVSRGFGFDAISFI